MVLILRAKLELALDIELIDQDDSAKGEQRAMI